jgi:5-methylcytosine-specific restriction endonuclease McrA
VVDAEPVLAPEQPRPPVPRPSVRPVAADRYSLRVTVDAAFKEDLDRLAALLSHEVPNGDLAAVLREAVRCAIEKHGKRRGAVEPARRKPHAQAQRGSSAGVPAEVRRQVWKRDGGQCTWRGPDGRRCTSRWRLELDHVHPKALGGPATVDNLRLLCEPHNLLHAEQVFGREHMARYRRKTPPPGEFTIAGDSGAARG